jgi:hypothetical protein
MRPGRERYGPAARSTNVKGMLRMLAIGAAAVVVVVSSADAKDFGPGDLRVCNTVRCVPVTDRAAFEALSAFYYTGERPPRTATRARIGAPAFELRFRNGYVTGIVATTRLDRFLSYGVNLGWFARGRWYRVPTLAARELVRLASALAPLHVTRASIAKSR